jgi:hypothetical protein
MESFKYLFYDKCAGGPTGMYDHNYDNEHTMNISVNDLTDDDYEYFEGTEAFERYDSKFKGVFKLEEEIFELSKGLFHLGLYEKFQNDNDNGDMHLMFAIIGIDVEKLEQLISSGQQVPYINFLCGLCEHHIQYTISGNSHDDDVDYVNGGVMLGNVYFGYGAGRFRLFNNDGLLNLMNENGKLKETIKQLQNRLYDEEHDKKIVTLLKLGEPIIAHLSSIIDEQYDCVINDLNDTITKLESACNDLISLQSKIDLDGKIMNTINTLKSKIDYYEQMRL